MTTTDLQQLLAEITPGPWREFIDDSGGQWTGWPISIDSVVITDKMVVRTGGQWPYKWDAKTSQHEACANARLIALAPDLAQRVIDLDAERDRLREALKWYGEQAKYCAKFNMDGESARENLKNDKGERARAALGEKNDG